MVAKSSVSLNSMVSGVKESRRCSITVLIGYLPESNKSRYCSQQKSCFLCSQQGAEFFSHWKQALEPLAYSFANDIGLAEWEVATERICDGRRAFCLRNERSARGEVRPGIDRFNPSARVVQAVSCP